ncbi:MAG: C45 family autoproteolytic acyltransferase/hydrolase [Planctomycetota bacterium]|jgi:hypothetical protein
MSYRLHCFSGTPYEAGFAVGRTIGTRLGEWHEKLVESWPERDGVIDRKKLREGALPWLESLPERYRLELSGLAEGSGVSLETIAGGYFAEECCCSGFIMMLDSHAWIGRNNDAWAPELWHGVTVHEITGRTPRIGFGFVAETFATTGMNRDRLWLHYNSGPPLDSPGGSKPCFYPHVVVTEALETCRSIADVEALLNRWERTRGMILFVVDGKTDESVIIECQCREHQRRPTPGGALIAANHSCCFDPRTTKGHNPEHGLQRSQARCARMEELLGALPEDADAHTLQGILAADGVEQRNHDRTTVFSNVACPATGQMWFAYGQGPAASTGTWSQVAWPW